MDGDKLPRIPDFSPSGKEIRPVTTGRSKVDKKTKLYLGSLLALFALVAVSAVAVGNPINIAKRALTSPAEKDATYNLSVYGLTCPSPNYWTVAEANPSECSSGDASIKCGELCPESRQTGIVNPEGHQCCRPAEPIVPITPKVTEVTPTSPAEKCVAPQKPRNLKIVFPVCGP